MAGADGRLSPDWEHWAAAAADGRLSPGWEHGAAGADGTLFPGWEHGAAGDRAAAPGGSAAVIVLLGPLSSSLSAILAARLTISLAQTGGQSVDQINLIGDRYHRIKHVPVRLVCAGE